MARVCRCTEDWRYHHAALTFEQIELYSFGAIPCDTCGLDREDDTPDERIKIVVEEITALKEKIALLTGGQP